MTVGRARRTQGVEVATLASRARLPLPPDARAAVLALQRSAGNAAVSALLKGRPSSSLLQRDTTTAEARRALAAELRKAQAIELLELERPSAADLTDAKAKKKPARDRAARGEAVAAARDPVVTAP